MVSEGAVPHLLTLKEVAALFQISESWLRHSKNRRGPPPRPRQKAAIEQMDGRLSKKVVAISAKRKTG